MPHLVDGVRQIIVVLQEIKSAEPQQFKGDAHVAVVVKPVKHPDTEAGEKGSDAERIRVQHSALCCSFPFPCCVSTPQNPTQHATKNQKLSYERTQHLSPTLQLG